ncbi:uncharacterized protein LOC131947840 isoform X2 [Physella acuta]|uniref:uncharacterized protein LOC131947840 isoform X2 n=1 Tax=Physella acuta TaxID=109671 RepID=UPI0027DD24C8|nr:uncharacterized protein LOC131947840 isoform X2 [Physella acuta]
MFCDTMRFLQTSTVPRFLQTSTVPRFLQTSTVPLQLCPSTHKIGTVVLCVVVTLLLMAVSSSCQYVTISPYVQTASLTNCHRGLLQEVDQLVFSSQISFGNSTSDWRSVVTYTVADQDNDFRCAVDVKYGCHGYKNELCYCNHTDNSNPMVFHIIINMTALQRYNQSTISGFIYSPVHGRVYSNSQQLPTIYSHDSLLLLINKKPLNKTHCSFDLQQAEQPVTLCCLQTAEPCTAAVLYDGQQVSVGSQCVTFTFNKTHTSNSSLVFKYNVCGSHSWTDNFTCSFIWAPPSSAFIDVILIVGVFVIAAIVILVAVAVVIYRRKRRGGKKLWDINKVRTEQTSPIM